MPKNNDLMIPPAFKNTGIIVVLMMIVFSSCSPTKHLSKEEMLLNKVKIKYKEQPILKEELYSLSSQKPNRRFLGIFRMYLGIYNLYYHKENSKIKDNIGEPPIIFDKDRLEPSNHQMKIYLNSRGFYDAKVNATLDTLGKQKVNVTYHVQKGNRYWIRDTSSQIDDPKIRSIYNETKDKTNIKPSNYFDSDILNKERKRIEKALKNRGYYKFNKEYVQFKADSSEKNKNVGLTTVILNNTKVISEDSAQVKAHETYTIKEVHIRISYREINDKNVQLDTLIMDGIKFIYSGKFPQVRPEVIKGLTFVRPGDLYRQDLQELTYRNLSGLRIFSYVSITYDQDFQIDNALIAYIDLSLNKQKSYTLESEGTNNGGNLGLNANLSFNNKNTFRGGEHLSISLSGGIESQQIFIDNEASENITTFLPFNTLEFGPEVNLEVPRFLLPFKTTSLSQKGNPRTTFNTSFNIQQRPDYNRNVSKVFISYAWNETSTKTHIIQPIDFSFIKLDPSSEFRTLLENIRNPFLRNSYTDNLILAAKYSFILNTQNSQKLKNDFFFRGNFETAGNLISTLSSGVGLTEDRGDFETIADIRYAQYLRSDIDFRFYQKFKENKMIYRLTSGIGVPFGNSVALPFEKSFYAGGANGIRAWQARRLGPGNLADSASLLVDQIGNMHLETNLEWRFSITNTLEGATFVDAGNIWNIKQEDTRDETEFKLSQLWRGTAVGAGIGLRINFTFFIFRLDTAFPIKDPGSADPLMIKPQWRNGNVNFGIGYPF